MDERLSNDINNHLREEEDYQRRVEELKKEYMEDFEKFREWVETDFCDTIRSREVHLGLAINSLVSQKAAGLTLGDMWETVCEAMACEEASR